MLYDEMTTVEARGGDKLKLTCFKGVRVGVSHPYESPSFSELGPGDVRFHLLELLDSQIWDTGLFFFPK